MKKEKGFFLISSYLTLTVIGTFSLAVFLKGVVMYHAAQRMESQIRAFHAAESGVDGAIAQLRNNLTYTGQGYTSIERMGGYEVQVETPDPARPTLRRITATGHAPNNAATSYAYARRQIVSYVNFSPIASGGHAVFSDTSIQMGGSVQLDSYDSRLGDYDSQTPRANGDLGTNTTGAGMVMISGSVRIRGDVIVGPGGNPSQVIRTSGSVTIEGSRLAAAQRRVLDPVQIPAGCVNQGSLSLAGSGTVTFSSGTYCYSSIQISGSVRVNYTGPATVYVTGGVQLAGSAQISSSGNTPGNLKLMVQGRSDTLIAGSSRLFGVLYAPRSGVQIAGSSQIYGSVTGLNLQQAGSSRIHYDEALNQNSGATTGNQSTLLAWTEV